MAGSPSFRYFEPMRVILVIGALFLVQGAWAQPGWQQKTDSVTRLIQQYYNQKNITALYNLGGRKFMSAIDPQKFNQATGSLFQQAGELTSYQFETITHQVAKYKATFSKAVLALMVGLDSADKLETFALVPYEKELPPKTSRVPTSNTLKTALDKKVDSLVSPFMKKGNTVGLALGMLQNGNTYVYGYGETAKDNQLLPDGNTLFEIGSITKTFTATLLAWFVQQGKIQLTDPVNKYLPDSIAKLEYKGKPITIGSLANHSSGLPRLARNVTMNHDPANPYQDYNDEALYSFLAHFTPTREPGAQYEYSNLAMGLLGVILERVSGKTYEHLLHEIIWQPLQMNHTRITLGSSDSAQLALGYDKNLQAVHSWEFQSMAGAGAIRSCINDMLLYAKAQGSAANTVLSKAIQLTHSPSFESGQHKLGLGWHIFTVKGKNYIAHDGQTGGYSSSMIVDPATGNAVVVLTNASVGPSQLSFDLIQTLEQK